MSTKDLDWAVVDQQTPVNMAYCQSFRKEGNDIVFEMARGTTTWNFTNPQLQQKAFDYVSSIING